LAPNRILASMGGDFTGVRMSTLIAAVEAEALKRSPEERVQLAEHLLASVAPRSEVDEAWATEVDRRLSEIECGRRAVVPLSEAIARARRALG
jgi:putative addiction module component (TIGR02574 family)